MLPTRLACAGACRGVPRLAALHTSAAVGREASKGPARNASRRPSGGAAYPNRPMGRGAGPSFKSKRPAPVVVLSPTSLLRKLDEHLETAWIGCTGSADELRTVLGLGYAEFAALARQFAHDGHAGLQHRSIKGKDRTHDGGEQQGAVQWDLDALLKSHELNGVKCIENEATAAFLRWAAAQAAALPHPPPTLSRLATLARLTDFSHAGEGFPFARQARRKLILHVGPTNSGKTYSALLALSRARTGVYAGPLRLLAHEVFTRFNNGTIGDQGKRVCNLVTGEEQRILDPNSTLSSCTVEMFPLTRKLEVGVLDEIQMIGDVQRGTAWTNAVLGAQCDELHLCGEESVVELIEAIALELGDACEVRRYKRLSPLKVADESLGSDLSKIRRGDCLVTFSRNNIFAMKRMVEEKTGLRVGVAYGGLPPEVREEQARGFNEGAYDVLVASDAVGMGLNLKIQRIVFETLYKWDPRSRSEVPLAMSQIKQIAGRAGRFGVHTPVVSTDEAGATTSGTVVGEVTTLDANDMALLGEAMNSPTEPITRAALGYQYDTLRRFSSLFPVETRLSTVIGLLAQVCTNGTNFYSVPYQSIRDILDAIQHVNPLSLAERNLFSACPANMRDENVALTIVNWIERYAAGEQVLVQQWSEETELDSILGRVATARAMGPSKVRQADDPSASIYTSVLLAQIESFHRCLTLYLWLSYRAPSIFCDMTGASLMRKSLESAIDFILAGMRFERRAPKTLRQMQLKLDYEQPSATA